MKIYTIFLVFFISIITFILTKANYTYINENLLKSREARIDLVSFRPVGKYVAVGLDLELPFVRVPLKRRPNYLGEQPAIVNINTASLVTSGLIAGGGIVVAKLFHHLGLTQQSRENEVDSSEHSKEERFDTESENNFMSLFEPFKLIYKNGSGERIETTLPKFLTTIEHTFLENNIDLGACMQKSICSLVNKAAENVGSGRANGLEKIIDGFTHSKWIFSMLEQYQPLSEAIAAGKLSSNVYCDVKYPVCKWAEPEQKLLNLMNTHVNFT